jgi:pilus assembly protein Flp/PilA
MTAFRHFLHDRRGATAIEYALIAAFIALVIISSVTALGPTLSDVFNDVEAGLDAANP